MKKLKILKHKKDFEIIQRPAVTEYFVWNCPECKDQNKTSEWVVSDNKLMCNKCHTEFGYKF